MIIVGISALHHDAGVAVLDTSSREILFAAHSERFSRRKNDKFLCDALIAEVKRFGPERAVWYEKPFRKRIRRAISCDFSGFTEESPRQHLARVKLDIPIDFVEHHYSHAAAGVFTSPFASAAVLVVDAIGEFETTTVWTYREGVLKKCFSRTYPQSLGLFYSAFTRATGFKPNEEEYILMALSAFGTDDAYGKILANSFNVEAEFPIVRSNFHYGVCTNAYDHYTREDIARGTQLAYEHVFSKILSFVRKSTGEENLVLMGGCALNCVANRLIRKYFSSWWIMPNPGDAGASLGAAAAMVRGPIHWCSPYLGKSIDGEYPSDAAVKELLKGQCVGIASGRAEFGPRALGNRSLLADPRGEKTKGNVNLVKKREAFRPFAPVVLEEHFSEMFDTHGERSSPYMQCVYRVKQPERFPAITHVDGTARVQTVNRKQHAGLYDLLSKFYQITGCPMLLNTSLNVKGMPLVNDERDAAAFRDQYGVKTFGAA